VEYEKMNNLLKNLLNNFYKFNPWV